MNQTGLKGIANELFHTIVAVVEDTLTTLISGTASGTMKENLGLSCYCIDAMFYH